MPKSHERAGFRHPQGQGGGQGAPSGPAVLYGSASGLSASGGQFFSQNTPGVFGGAETEDGFGSALGVGDFNNDNFADLAIGVPSEGLDGASQAGAVNVLYGSAARLTATGNQQFFQGNSGIGGVAELGDEFGFVLTGGDFNNDSFDDLAIGVPFEDVGTVSDAGAINVLYGSAANLATTGQPAMAPGQRRRGWGGRGERLFRVGARRRGLQQRRCYRLGHQRPV